MAYLQYLVFNQEKLPLPDSYDLDLSDVEADSGGETEREQHKEMWCGREWLPFPSLFLSQKYGLGCLRNIRKCQRLRFSTLTQKIWS